MDSDMDALVIASDEADARAAAAVERPHAQLAGALALKVESLAALARAGQPLDEAVRSDLVDWCRTELVPHALAEEGTLYRSAAERPEGRLLVEAMLAEHQVILGLVEDLEQATDPGHDHDHAEANPEPAEHRCACHDEDAAGLPELDARVIPHAIRHATIFGALDGLQPGHGLVLVAPHDPLRLLAQLEGRAPGALAMEYLERGPEAWRLSLVRADPVPSDV